MFTVDPNIIDLNIRNRNIHKMFYSLNVHQVTLNTTGAEDARCYVLFLRENARLGAYIGLSLTGSSKRFFYVHTSNPFPDEQFREVLVEAQEFAEAMGFLLDEVDLQKMSLADRSRWIDEQDIFSVIMQPEIRSAGTAPVTGVQNVPPQRAPVPEVQPLKREIRKPSVVTGREKEALARLLASF